MCSSEEPPPRFTIALSEYVIVAGITAGLWAVLYPSVNAARDSRNQPPILPWLQESISALSPVTVLVVFPVLACMGTWLSFYAFRCCLPLPWRRHFPWFKPRPAVPVPQVPMVPVNDSRPALGAAVCSIAGSLLLIIGVLHVRSDRTHRRPVITWEGPLAEYVGVMFGTGWTLSILAIVIGFWACDRFRSRSRLLDVAGLMIGIANLVFSVLLCAGLYED